MPPDTKTADRGRHAALPRTDDGRSEPPRGSHPRYRPDIDGLRAVAVGAVVANHLHWRVAPGGYVGVDIFFVISGYLITSIVSGQVARGEFSFAEFYKRRALRLMPALLSVLAATSLAAYVILLPTELVAYAKTLLGTVLFASNAVLYNEISYFNAASGTWPLLHTWSLGVEEQFYLFWPVLLIAIVKGGRAWTIASIAFLFAASLAGAVAALPTAPAFVFYMIPTRTWEFVVGAALALGLHPRSGPRWLRDCVALAGLAAIAFSIKRYASSTPFPGLAALPATLGTAAIIWAGTSGSTWVSRCLSWKPVVFVGRISYSLYLVHWPIIVFAGIVFDTKNSAVADAVLLAACFAAAWVNWWLVEQPARREGDRMPRGLVLRWAALGCVAPAALAGLVIADGGLPRRLSPEARKVASYQGYDGDAVYRGATCFVVDWSQKLDRDLCLKREAGRKTVLIFGDSHAAQLWPGLSQVADGVDLLQATGAGCLPVLGTMRSPSHCGVLMRWMFEQYLPQNHVDVLVVTARWNATSVEEIDETLRTLSRYADAIVFVGPTPEYTTSLPRLLVRGIEQGADGAAAADAALDRSGFALDRALGERLPRKGLVYMSVLKAICRTRCPAYARPEVPLQFDYGHLTREGSLLVARQLWPAIRTLLDEPRS